jgi:predicted NUDIX family NTP pyrophosphohydrolase
MNPYDRPADDVKVVIPADWAAGPYSFKAEHGSHAVLHVEEAGGGVLAVVTKAGKERVLTVAAGEEIPVFVREILMQTGGEIVDGYAANTATDVAKVRAYLWD